MTTEKRRDGRVSILVALVGGLACLSAWGADPAPPAAPPAPSAPEKVYVPYEKMKGLLDAENQGVFLPYKDFQRLWQAAQGAPAEAGSAAAPAGYLISAARFDGVVGAELATLKMELTVDILADGWVSVPLGLGEAAVAKASFAKGDEKAPPLLRIANGGYVLLTKGPGRKVVNIEFVRQLQTQPGLNVLEFALPKAAITTLEMVIPEQDMKVDVEPMLAATTSQSPAGGAGATKLQAFLGAAERVKLSWKPKTQAAAELQPVVISSQIQHIHVAEALISHDLKFTYDIRRRGVDTFTIQLPGDFRVTSVDGANISKWDVSELKAPAGPAGQLLKVKLFSPAEDSYSLGVKMERFLKESQVLLPLTPAVTQEVLRRTGLVAVTHAPRRSVELRDLKGLSRVDTGRLPADLSAQAGVTAYEFTTADHSATLAVGSVEPRIEVSQRWSLGVDDSWQQLEGQLTYTIERAGIFRLSMSLPEPWELLSLGPGEVVDEFQFSGAGADRQLSVLLKREVIGGLTLSLKARRPRAKSDEPVRFPLPLLDKTNLRHYSGRLVLHVPANLTAQVEASDQMQPLSLTGIGAEASWPGLTPQMCFQFSAVDRDKPAGASFRIAAKPSQVSAVVHRLVHIQPGAIADSAAVQFNVLYAPVDVFYVQVPADLADAGVQITGDNIKEWPRVAAPPSPPSAEGAATRPATAPSPGAAYYKVVLQSPVTGAHWLFVSCRRPFKAGKVGAATMVKVEPILAAGALSDQSGQVALAKADTLAIGQPTMTNLTPCDPGSAADLPYGPHRRVASLAFKYTRPPFELSLPVVTQEEAAVISTMATGTIVEQILTRDGRLNGRVVYLITSSKGDRLPISMPPGAKLYGVLLNGAEAPVEVSPDKDQRIVRLPPSAGQVTKAVLDIRYGQENVSAGSLLVPSLPKEVAFQVTLWRLWIPSDDLLLSHDRLFSQMGPGEAQRLLAELGANQPAPVAFVLAGQGQEVSFQRQGAPGPLSVTLMQREWFAVLTWVAILVAGVAMLPLRGFSRLLISLVALVLLAGANLWAPRLAGYLVVHGVLAGLVVLAMWWGQWFFLRRRSRPGGAPPPPAPSGTASSAADANKE